MTDYHFYIHYKPGTENKVADSLSRFPIQSQIDMSEYKEIVHDEEIKAVFRYASRGMLAESADMKKEDRRQLPHEACVLLQDYQNLSADDKRLLFRKISSKKQK